MKYSQLSMLLALALPPLSAAYSQTADPADSGLAEAIVVTGSNIKRTDYEGPQTVVVFDQKKIEQSGARTINDLLRKLPENAAGFSENVGTGVSFSPGAAAASLRGLGVSSTLVLLNGRRIAPFPLAQSGTDSFVDLNSIPLGAVARIEILKEGASAVYGSDAIAGVINIILKDNYNGGEIETYYGNTTRNDAAEVKESFLSGISNERFRLFLSGNYLHRNSLADVDRPYSASVDHRRFGGSDLRSVRGNPGTIFFSGNNQFPDGAAAVPRGSNGRLGVGEFKSGFLPDGNFRNRYDYNKDSELVPETQRWGGMLTFGYNLTPHLELFGESSYQSVRTKTMIAPSNLDSDADNLVVPATNPFNPFGEDVGFVWRSVETGPRRDTSELDAYRYLAGVKLKDLPNNWSAEAAALYSESNIVSYSTAGYLSAAAVQDALNDTNPGTALNLFGDGRGINHRGTLRGLLARPRVDGLAYIWSYDVKASGELFALPAGPVSLAVGSEYREESLSQSFSDPLGSVVGFGAAGSAGDRDVRSAFFELAIPITSPKWNLPLVRAFELSIAERYDDYSDFGSTAKPKFGFKWKPMDGLLFRGAYSEGFRAPSLPQLFTGTVSGFETVTDPGTNITNDVSVLTGGNPALQPETSYSYFLGAIIEPPFLKGFSIETDFYRIEQRNLITQPSAQDIVDGRAPGAVNFGANGGITSINALFANLGTVVVDGVDIALAYRLETGLGTLTFDSRSTFMNSYEERQPGTANLDVTDSFALPEFKMVNSVFYNQGGFEAGVSVNYIDSYDDQSFSAETHKIGSWTTVDLQMSYEWNFASKVQSGSYAKDGKTAAEPATAGLTGWQRLLDGTKVTVGVLNVGDAEPPFADQVEGYDAQTADPYGRFIYASLRKKFW